MQLTNLDLIDTEPALVVIFGEMRETGPFNDTFEKAGYKSTNFFIVCGPMVLIMIAFLVWVPIRKLL